MNIHIVIKKNETPAIRKAKGTNYYDYLLSVQKYNAIIIKAIMIPMINTAVITGYII